MDATTTNGIVLCIASHILTDLGNALDPEQLDKLMLLRPHYKQNNAFQ